LEEVQFTVNDKLITVSPVFDPSHPDLCPEQLDYETLLTQISRHDTWERTGNAHLSRIAADYGRSHYFFTNGLDTIPKAIHEICFRTNSTVSTSDRTSFLSEIGISEDLANVFDGGPSPTLSCLLTRVKFELLKKYFEEMGRKESAGQLALNGMHLTTQDNLCWIRMISEQVLSMQYPNLTVTFAFFQSDITLSDSNTVVLQVTLINYKPHHGCWQAKKLLPTDNKKEVTATFIFDLENGVDDTGVLHIRIGKKHKKYKKHINNKYKSKLFGIYNASTQTCIKFVDTMPTW